MQNRPRHALEKLMRLYLLCIVRIHKMASRCLFSVRSGAQAGPWLTKKLIDKIPGVVADLLDGRVRPLEGLLVSHDRSLGVLAIVSAEGREAVQTFEEYDADAPLVTPAVVRTPFDHFRGHVLRRANNRVCKRSP